MTDDTQRQMFIADVMGRLTRANIIAMGMQAENHQRVLKGESIAYQEADFLKIIEDESINDTAIHNTLWRPL